MAKIDGNKLIEKIIKSAKKETGMSERQIMGILASVDNPAKFLTANKKLKKEMSLVDRDFFISELIRYVASLSRNKRNKLDNEDFKKCTLLFYNMHNIVLRGGSVVDSLKSNNQLLNMFIELYVKYKYENHKLVETNDTYSDPDVRDCLIVTGLKVRKENVEKIFESSKPVFITSNQENRKVCDCSTSISKGNSKYKLMAVSSGPAQIVIIRELERWFESLNESIFKNSSMLEYLLTRKIKELSRKVDSINNSLVVAVTNDENTIVESVGNCACYTIIDGQITQVNKEDTLARDDYDCNEILDKEDIRFSYNANKFTKYIGMKRLQPNVYFIGNGYDDLLLLSSGVTTSLTDEHIRIVSTSDDTDIAKKLTEDSSESVLFRTYCYDSDYFKEMVDSKDKPSTAICYKKQMKRKSA